MSERAQPDRNRAVEAIAPPPVAPSDTPSETVKRETAEYEKASLLGRESPTVRHLHSNEQLIAELRKSNEYLAANHAEIKLNRDGLQSELDLLRPKHAALRRSNRINSVYGFMAAVVMTSGSGLVSSPSYLASRVAEKAKADSVGMAVFGGGWGLLAAGALMLLVITLSSLIFDR